MSEQIAIIPSIAERCHRDCKYCAFNSDYKCNAVSELGYGIKYERTAFKYNPEICLNHDAFMLLPCRFHLTADELKCILDPYFME